MAQLPIPVQLLHAFQRYINYTEEREQDLIRRIVDLDNRCANFAIQINALNRGMLALQAANAQPAPPAQVQSGKAQGPPPKKAPPPLPVEETEPGPIGPQPVDMEHESQYQRKNGFKAAPPNTVVMSLNLEVPKLPPAKAPAFNTKAFQPPPVPPKPPQQNPPIPPPAQIPPVKPPPHGYAKLPSTAAVNQQSFIV